MVIQQPVSERPAQMLLDIFANQQERQMHEAIQLTNESRKRRMSSTLVLKFIESLQLQAQAEALLEIEAEQLEAETKEHEDKEEVLKWSDQSIAIMQSVLLTRSLEVLAGSGDVNALDKISILEWIDAPDIVLEHRGRQIFQEDVDNFSFRCCCKAEGYDPDDLRDQIYMALINKKERRMANAVNYVHNELEVQDF